MACRDEVALRCIHGQRQRRAVRAHLIDVDRVEHAHRDRVGFGQEQSARARASYARRQPIDADLQMIVSRAGTLVVCRARGDNTHLVSGDVVGRAVAGGNSLRAQAHVCCGAQTTQRQRGGRHVADVAVLCRGGGAVGHSDGIGTHVDGARASRLHITVCRLRQSARGHQADVTATRIHFGIQRQIAGDIDQHVAAAFSHQRRAGRHARAQNHTTTCSEHDGAVAGRAQVFARAVNGAGRRCAVHTLDIKAQRIDRHRVGFGDEHATAASLCSQTHYRGFDVVVACTDAHACLQDQVGRRDVHVGIVCCVRNRATIGKQSNIAQTRRDGAQRDIAVHALSVSGLQAYIAVGAVIGRDNGASTHGDVATRLHVDGVACTAGGDIGVLQQVAPSMDADMTSGARYIGTQCDVARCIASLEQQVARCSNGSAIGRRQCLDSAGRGLQHQMTCGVQIVLCRVCGCG